MGAFPEHIERILDAALVSELTVVNAAGRPISHPMIPLYDGEKLYFHSSSLFSKKLAHVRANPRVSVAITDLGATHGERLPDRLTVQGEAVLYEGDVHEEWQRILPLWIAKEPVVKMFYAKRVALPLFWERVIIEVTPRRALLWAEGRTDVPPAVFEASRI